MNSLVTVNGVLLEPLEDESEGGLGCEEAVCESGDGQFSSEIKCVVPFMRSSSAGVRVGSDV